MSTRRSLGIEFDKGKGEFVDGGMFLRRPAGWRSAAAWRMLGWPAKGAQKAAVLYAQRVEAAERHGEVKPAAVKLTGDGIRGGGGLPWGRRKGAPQKGNGSRRGRGGSPAHQLAAWGSRWAGEPAAKGGGGTLCFSVARG